MNEKISIKNIKNTNEKKLYLKAIYLFLGESGRFKRSAMVLWQFSYCYDAKFWHLQELKIYQILLKNAFFQDTVSVHRPGFYAHRFLDFMADKVFKKIPSRKILYLFFLNFIYIYIFISSHFFRKCKPAFQKLFYLTIVKNRESLII
jgi:hypothetical protein